MKFKILALVLSLALHAKAQTDGEMRAFLIPHEGYATKTYILDGKPHAGIGHLLLPGEWRRTYSRETIENWFKRDINLARMGARAAVVNFERHPEDVRMVLISLAYNCGVAGLYRFTKFRAAMERYDYRTAVQELRASLWAQQVPHRANHHIGIIAAHIR